MLWARLYGPTGDNDAVYIGFNGNYDRAFPDNAWGVYQWVGVEVSHGSGNFLHPLDQGQNQINIGHGEGGARIDMLLITTNQTYIPSGVGQQYHRADTEIPFGCVDMQELTNFISLWHTDSTAYPMREMMEAVSLWKSGAGCNP